MKYADVGFAFCLVFGFRRSLSIRRRPSKLCNVCRRACVCVCVCSAFVWPNSSPALLIASSEHMRLSSFCEQLRLARECWCCRRKLYLVQTSSFLRRFVNMPHDRLASNNVQLYQQERKQQKKKQVKTTYLSLSSASSFSLENRLMSPESLPEPLREQQKTNRLLTKVHAHHDSVSAHIHTGRERV